MIDILHKRGELDCLDYYSQVARKLEKFLKGRELATKIFLKDFFFLKRGSKDKPLFIEDLREVDAKMLSLRKHHLEEVKDKLNDKQELIWKYFVPRKMINFFYACNGENPGKLIDRVFIDIDIKKILTKSSDFQDAQKSLIFDRKKHSPDDARKVALSLIKTIKKDKEFNKMFKFKSMIMWTGSSFHIYLDLNKKINQKDYEKYLSYGKKKEDSFIMKWARLVSKETGLNVLAGHEKQEEAIILDSSNTPSGKLARIPFSLHVIGFDKYDGVAVPVSEQQLGDKKLIGRLRKLSPNDILRKLGEYSRLIT